MHQGKYSFSLTTAFSDTWKNNEEKSQVILKIYSMYARTSVICATERKHITTTSGLQNIQGILIQLYFASK